MATPKDLNRADVERLLAAYLEEAEADGGEPTVAEFARRLDVKRPAFIYAFPDLVARIVSPPSRPTLEPSVREALETKLQRERGRRRAAERGLELYAAQIRRLTLTNAELERQRAALEADLASREGIADLRSRRPRNP
ncbi:hypothetical protein [Frondihabitans australicus]|uniref:hypothetical protein n=1 Tax=Frondihabitans australicus TaxID=386892 RepID=UPI0011C37DFF|nr:hypothetical protein [Frondihabitans australicus]